MIKLSLYIAECSACCTLVFTYLYEQENLCIKTHLKRGKKAITTIIETRRPRLICVIRCGYQSSKSLLDISTYLYFHINAQS